jgi:hypothetical protein
VLGFTATVGYTYAVSIVLILTKEAYAPAADYALAKFSAISHEEVANITIGKS